MRSGRTRSLWATLRQGENRLASHVEIDTRSLAVFRILAGLLVVVDVFARSRNFRQFYTEDGLVPQWLAREAISFPASVHFVSADPAVAAALFVLTGLVGVQLLVGYRTRLATALAFVLVVSFDLRNPFVLSYADTLFAALLFWGLFLPLGERWSVDAVYADREPRGSVASLASAFVLFQMVYMYVRNGYLKTQSDAWTTGEAAAIVLGLDNITFLFGDLTREVPMFLQFGGLLWFAMLLSAWLLVVLHGRSRLPLLALFFAGHAAFALTVRIGAFPYVAFLGLVCFFQPSHWADGERIARRLGFDGFRYQRTARRLRRVAERLPYPRYVHPTIETLARRAHALAVGLVVATLVLSLVVTHLPLGAAVGAAAGPEERIESVTDPAGLPQPEWSIFAPNPRSDDVYYVFAAETETGDLVDVYGDRPLAWDRPVEPLHLQYETYRERFYMNSISDAGYDREPHSTDGVLAETLCETWADEDGNGLVRISMYEIRERVTMETLDSPDERERRTIHLSDHACDGTDPERIAAPANLTE